MPLEIEAKMQLADTAAVEKRLTELGATAGPDIFEVNTFFDTPSGQLKSADQGLRIRVEHFEGQEPSRVLITHKGPRSHEKVKTRPESEVTVHDAAAATHLLRALGYTEVLSFEKRRRQWDCDGCHVVLDTLPYLGGFIEIEGPSNGQVLAVREKLGLSNIPLIHASYIAMLSTYLAEHDIHANYVALE